MVKLFSIIAVESGKFIRRAGFTGDFPTFLPCVFQFIVFIRIVVQLFAFPVRLIPAAHSKPPVVPGHIHLAIRQIFDGSARAEHDGIAAFRIVVAAIKQISSVLRKIAYPVVAHASLSRHRQNKQRDHAYSEFHNLSLKQNNFDTRI